MEVKDVWYHSIFGKVEDLGTDEVNTFKALDGFSAEISETENGIEINAQLNDGECIVAKSKHTGRVGLKIAYAKLLRKILKLKIEVIEEDAAKTEIRDPDGLTDTVINTSWVTNFPTGNGLG